MKRICELCEIGDIVDGMCDICGREDQSPEIPRLPYAEQDRMFTIAIIVSILSAIAICGIGIYSVLK